MDLIGRAITLHVCFKTLYIPKPSHAKEQCEITTICVIYELKSWRQIILISIWNSMLLLYVMLKLRCGAVWDGKQMEPIFEILIKGRYSFFNRSLPWHCCPDCLRSLFTPWHQYAYSPYCTFPEMLIRKNLFNIQELL